MGFRERPEYVAWRDAVAALFGEKCMLCGHEGNIHMHHIRPVEDYPELAFDPKNGVPLCGNCHTKVKGRELEFADEFQRLQDEYSGTPRNPAPTIEELRQAAVADPSNEAAVFAFLAKATDPKQAVEFYVENQASIKMTSRIAGEMSFRLNQLGKHIEAIRFAEMALELARTEGNAAQTVDHLIFWKLVSLEVLGRGSEVRPYLENLAREFPDNADLHYRLTQGTDPTDCLTHALRAAQLCPEKSLFLAMASFHCAINDRQKDAMDFAKRAFACARDDKDRIRAIAAEARVFQTAKLYDDALTTYRKALEINPQDAGTLAGMAHCLYMSKRINAAADMARRCLLYDPTNSSAKSTLSYCAQRN